MKGKYIFKFIFILVLTNLYSCGNDTETFEVTINSDGYSQSELSVQSGDKVTWINKDTKTHTVSSGVEELWTFDSGEIKPGEEFSFEFLEEMIGTHIYYCKIHGNEEMEGIIIIQPEGYKK